MRILWSSFATLLVLSRILFAQYIPVQTSGISGVINEYAHVLDMDSCYNTMTIPSTTPFAIGDRILIIQMSGATMDETNTSAYGQISDFGQCGVYEIAIIGAIPDGTHIRFANQLLNHYDIPNGLVQLVRIPQYSDVVISAPVIAQKWNAAAGTGGVVILESTGMLTLQSDISATGAGFSGGAASFDGTDPSSTNYFSDPLIGIGGGKGEGIARVANNKNASRGAPANGGGGGNAHNSGGGGGSNFGYGGSGGDETNHPGFARYPNGGIGGHRLGIGPTRQLFMGGGGGGGHQNDGKGSAGSAGGGIVIIIAKSIFNSGGKIIANGEDALPSTIDGAGGAGAGGTIVIEANSMIGNAKIFANGGNGGNSVSQNDTVAYGPGGGGGGGVYYGSTAIAPNVNPSVLGGKSGRVRSNTSIALNNTPYGALDGTDGELYDFTVFQEGNIPFSVPIVQKQFDTICSGDSISILASGGDSYLWTPSTGLSDPTQPSQKISPSISTIYRVAIKKGLCTYVDSVSLTVLQKPSVTITGPLTVCKDTKATYTIAAVAGEIYDWTIVGGSPAAVSGSSVDITWNTSGQSTITLHASNGKCTNDTSITVTVGTELIPTILGVSSVCEGDTITLSADANYASYLWSTGETTPEIKVWQSGDYTLAVSDVGGCSGTSALFSVVVHPKPTVTITSSAILLPIGGSLTLYADKGFSSYKWNTGSTFDSIIITSEGTYSVTIIDANGCEASDSITISIEAPIPHIELAIGTVQGYPGDHILVPINIISSSNLDSIAAINFTAYLRFNRSLLVPSDRSIASTFSNRERTIQYTGTINNLPTATQLPAIPFVVTLGDSSETTIFLDSITWSGSPQMETVTNDGFFTLLGICPQGGQRLYDPTGKLSLENIIPNPVQDIATIDYELLEDGVTELDIVDMMGRKVASIDKGNLLTGLHRSIINVSEFTSGIYTVRLRTPTQIRMKRMEVYR